MTQFLQDSGSLRAIEKAIRNRQDERFWHDVWSEVAEVRQWRYSKRRAE
ncbi:MAG: hypothetical protein HY675_28370 [Chloroflexi bacterium]|nr:hypothetical protein [Chloroflexota bacterium]